jgi:hypothetical protein
VSHDCIAEINSNKILSSRSKGEIEWRNDSISSNRDNPVKTVSPLSSHLDHEPLLRVKEHLPLDENVPYFMVHLL